MLLLLLLLLSRLWYCACATDKVRYSELFPSRCVLPVQQLAYFQYSLDGAPWLPCDATLEVGPVSVGEHTLHVRTVDMTETLISGNASYTWQVQSQTGSTLSLSGLTDGAHTLTVTAFDDVVCAALAHHGITGMCSGTRPLKNRTASCRRRVFLPAGGIVCESCADDVRFGKRRCAGKCRSLSRRRDVDRRHAAAVHQCDAPHPGRHQRPHRRRRRFLRR